MYNAKNRKTAEHPSSDFYETVQECDRLVETFGTKFLPFNSPFYVLNSANFEIIRFVEFRLHRTSREIEVPGNGGAARQTLHAKPETEF